MVSYFKGCLRLVAVTFQITFLFYFFKFIFDITAYQNNPKIQKKKYFEAKKKQIQILTKYRLKLTPKRPLNMISSQTIVMQGSYITICINRQ
jgi:hypothetical protein